MTHHTLHRRVHNTHRLWRFSALETARSARDRRKLLFERLEDRRLLNSDWVFDNAFKELTLQLPDGTTERVLLRGTATMTVETDEVGAAADTDNDGLDQVQAQWVQMDLAGSSSMGPVLVRLDPSRASLGEIEEAQNNTLRTLDLPPYTSTGWANSFFDVFVEIDLAGQHLHTELPERVQAGISHGPPAPGEAYFMESTEPLSLVDVNGNMTGLAILDEQITPNPVWQVDVLPSVRKELVLQLPSGTTERIVLAGTATMAAMTDDYGTAADADADGLDEVPTELVALDLAGTSSLGPLHVSLNPETRSLGLVEEQANDVSGMLDLPRYTGSGTGSADSFFDVFVEIDLGDRVLQAAAAEHLQATVTDLPPGPGETHETPSTMQSIPLLDANGRPSGESIVSERLTLTPPTMLEYFPFVRKELVLQWPDGVTETVRLGGTATAQIATDAAGTAADTDGDGLDQVPTELVAMNLSGNSSRGLVSVRLDPGRPSLGEMEETANDTPGILDVAPYAGAGLVDSFFDVFVEIEIDGQPLYTEVSERLESQLTTLPPDFGETYTTSVDMQPIALLDRFGQPTNVSVLSERLTPNPEREVDYFPCVQKELVLRLANGVPERVLLTGSMTMEVGIDPSGSALDTDGDGLDQVPTELTELHLTGTSSLGPLIVRLDPTQRSVGELEELVNSTPGTLDLPPFTATGSAFSFFDVFVEVEVGGQKLHTLSSERLRTLITRKPAAPGETYSTPPDMMPIGLVSADALPVDGQNPVMWIVSERLTPIPLGSIRVVKEAVPDDPQDFIFTSPELGNFILDDDSDPLLTDSRTFFGLAPGAYVVTEQAVPGWNLTDIAISDPDGGSLSDLFTGVATLDLDPGENITVTFTNRLNQPPIGDAGGPYLVDEGGSVQLDASNSNDDIGIVQYEWDFDYDGAYDDDIVTGVHPTFSAETLDGPTDRTVGLRVTDEEGLTHVATALIHVRNVAPTVTDLDLTPEEIDEGETATLSGTVTDPAAADTLTLEVEWGEGATEVIPLVEPLPTGVSYDSDTGAFSVSHLYVDDGPSPGNGTASDLYAVTGRVVDDDGGWAPLRRPVGPRIANDVNDTGWSVTQQIQVGEPIGQTFTAISDNPLSTISFYVADMNKSEAPSDYSLTFELYEGEGTSGQLLARRDYTALADDFSGFVEVDFSAVTLVEGAVYTAALSNDTARWGRMACGNQYAGGTAIYAGAPSPTSDALFVVQWQPDSPAPRIGNEVNETGWSVTQQIQVGEPIGQTFTAISNNRLSTISFYVADMNASAAPDDYSLTFELYEGGGAGGRLLGRREYTGLSDGFSGFVTVDFSSVTLVDGHVYTAMLSNDTARWGRRAIGNQYAGGTAIYAGAASPTSDALFAVQWQPDSSPPRIANDDNQTGWSVTQQIQVGEPIGQTFTAISNNPLSEISFYVADMNSSAGPEDHSLNFELYEGEGVSGRLLGRREYTGLPADFSGFISADFSSVTLVAGEVYTAVLTNDTARWGRRAIGNQYAGGTAIYAGAASPTADALFAVQWQPDSSPPRIANDDNQTGWAVTQQIQVGEPIGQTFTAISDNPLATVSFYIADMNKSEAPSDYSVTFELYEGEGTSGQLLGRRDYTALTDDFSGFVEVDFSSVTLFAGEVYTAVLSNDTARWGRRACGNQYAGGTAIYAGLPSPTSDALFRVQWQPDTWLPQIANDDNQTGWSVTQQIQVGEPIGQTFTPISNNRLSGLSFFVADMNTSAAPDDHSVTFELYEGVGTGGRLLGTRDYTGLPDGFSGFISVDFSAVTLVDGQVVTAALSNDTARWGRRAIGNQYAGGTSLYAGASSPTSDALFRIGWQADPSLLTVLVHNVPPELEAGPDEDLTEGVGSFSRTIAFTDPGELDEHQVTVDYGDGSPVESIPVSLGARQFDLAHTYVDAGDYTVTVAVADDDLGRVADSFTVSVRFWDWGDAPDSAFAAGYPTLNVNNGARHMIRGPWLGDAGDRPDAERDGQPHANALGDDLAPTGLADDEDGVVFPPLVVGQTNYVFIQVHADATLAAYVDGWIDFNGDQQWDASEQFIGGMLGPGVHYVPVTVPNTAVAGTTFARVRVSNEGGLAPTGAAESGEVEDHEVQLVTLPPNPKWVQLPDLSPSGIDVQIDDSRVAADDFLCRETSLLTDVHLWGSWKGDDRGQIQTIEIRVHPDDPSGPGGTDLQNEYSKPEADVLWSMNFVAGEFTEQLYYTEPDAGEFWWDPVTGELLPGGDREVWQIDIPIDRERAFLQKGSSDEPVVYWLDVRVTTDRGDFGWKTRQWPEHFMDDAVWDFESMPPTYWREMRYPPGHPYHDQDANSIDLAYVLTFEPVLEELDWGDAPEVVGAAGYPTTQALDGARHVIRGPWLGDASDAPDAEPDGQPHPQALGDDMAPSNTDDEDGVAIPPLVVGQTNYVSFEVSLPGGSTGQAYVDGWIDYDGNMQWDASESFVSGWFGPGVHTVAVTPPATSAAMATSTFARVRINSKGPLGPQGLARDGEVEDHEVRLVNLPENTKWAQLPDLSPNGIDVQVDNMRIAADDFLCTETSLLTDVHLWGSWMNDTRGEIQNIHLSIHADDPVGPDGTSPDNTHSMPEPKELWGADFVEGQFEESLYYTVPEPGEFWWDPQTGELLPGGDSQVWRIDIPINPDDAFLQEGTNERPLIYWLDVSVTTENGQFGWKTRQWPDHFMDDAVWDSGSELPRQWRELRYPQEHPYHGLEDDSIDLAFALTFQETPPLDWGDAPDSVLAVGYPTLAINNGAHHVIRGPWLGDVNDQPDAEPDGQPHPHALGDDLSAAGLPDDEDGVTIPPLVRGQTNYVFFEVQTLPGRSAYVDGWIDYNGDRTWDNTEQIVSGWYGPGMHTVTVTPPVASTGVATTTFARFRINSQGPLSPMGRAIDGEVEDHEVQLIDLPENTKWVQLPDLSPQGIDVQVDGMRIAADDFECTERSLLTDVHLWGSWKEDVRGEIRNIHLSIHADDPVGPGGTLEENLFSQPEPDPLWEGDFAAGQFGESLYYTVPDRGEYWWDPQNGELIAGGDSQVWQIDISIDPDDAFLQRGTPDDPVIYWLDVRVTTEDGQFGWKTRQWPDHYLDDAVWDAGSELPRTWQELVYPPGHAYHDTTQHSVDMAFALTFEKVTQGSIHGYKFEDLNGNGIDEDEPRLGDVEIQLRDRDVLPSYVQAWDVGPGDWQYWVEDPLDVINGGRNEPVKWSPAGGYGDSGYISTPLEELFVTHDSFWPAYMAPPDPVDPVDLTDKTVHIRVNDFGTSGLPDESLRMFIGEWNAPDDYRFYAHNTPIPINDNWSVLSTFDIGDDSDWTLIEGAGPYVPPSDLYVNPEQWGFTLVGLDATSLMPALTGRLAFDELRVVDEIVATTSTNDQGEYAFDRLEPGRRYLVTEIPPAGSVQTTLRPAPIELKEGVEWVASREQADALIAQGMDPNKIVIYPPLAFGNTFPGSIHGIKYEDMNGNGQYDPLTDNRWGGVTITLTGDVDGDGVLDTITTVTDANGEYAFTGLYPGTYTVEETPPSGSIPTTAPKVVVIVQSREEVVALSGLADITDPNDPRYEVPEAVMFGQLPIRNYDFEGGTYADGDDMVPNLWTKVETFTGGPGEISVISTANDNGPSLPGTAAAHFVRTGGGASGDRTQIQQELSIDATTYHKLELALDVKVVSHDLCGGGWAGAWEYPVSVIVAYNDSLGVQKNAQFGWYLNTSDNCDATDNWKWWDQSNRWAKSRQVAANVWQTETIDLLDPVLDIAQITRIVVGGSGWSFEALADNIVIQGDGLPISLAFGNQKSEIEVDVFPESVGQLLVELPAAPGIITPNSDLPPTEGVYRSSGGAAVEYWGPNVHVVLGDLRHRALADPPPVITNVGMDEQESFQSSLLGSAVLIDPITGLEGELVQMELAGPVQTIVRNKADAAWGSFQAEIVEMTLEGLLPGGPQLLIRESSTRASVGQTTITDLGGGLYHIDSFFDVFTELSVDGGDSWLASTDSTRIQLVEPGIVTASSELPATDGEYRSPQDVHATYAGPDLEIVLEDVRHRPLAYPSPVRTAMGSDEVEDFQSSLLATGVLTVPSLGLDHVPVPVELTGPVETIVRGKVDNATGDFQAEIVSMELSGEVLTPDDQRILLIIRESASQPSLGQTTINERGEGRFSVESFFDVFTELSVDGGQNWIAATDKVRVELNSPPQLIPLVGPAEVHVFFEGSEEGDARDDDSDGRDEVATEIVSLDLRGMTPQGPIQAGVRDDRRSLGQIEEQVNNTPGRMDLDPFHTGAADSFFDVWPEITVGGQVMVTDRPLRLVTPIEHKPPQDGERYVNPYLTRVELIDPTTGQGTGIYVLREIHQPAPTTEVDVFPVSTAWVQLVGGTLGPAPASLLLQGPAETHVYFEGPNHGDAVDDDGDGLEEVVTQLVSADLVGSGVTMRIRKISESPFAPSLGQIAERANGTPGTLDVAPFATGVADSFFDVFVELDLPDGSGGTITVHNEQPLRFSAEIAHKPPEPDTVFATTPGARLRLYDEAGNPTEIFVADSVYVFGPWLPHFDFDFGDAPDAAAAPGYPTLLGNNGARHVIGGPWLGDASDTPDAELDGQPHPQALGDDLGGPAVDDEDGVTIAPMLLGHVTYANVTVNTGGAVHAYVDGWIDFNQDGVWDASEQFVSGWFGPGVHTLTVTPPASALPGETFARVRINSRGPLGPEGSAADGEVEDHRVVMRRDVTVDLPGDNGSDDISVRRNGVNVEVYDHNTNSILASAPLDYTRMVTVNGTPTEHDRLTVDYDFGGFFALPDGIHFEAGSEAPDELIIQGTGDTTWGTLSVLPLAVGVREGGPENRTSYAGVESLSVLGMLGVAVDEAFHVGDAAVTVESAGFVDLGTALTISGGTFAAAGGMRAGASGAVLGHGTLAGPVSSAPGSVITMTGNMALGDSASYDGVDLAGRLNVGANTVTLLDGHKAVLGSQTTLGDLGVADGTLNAANGVELPDTHTFVGQGEVNTVNGEFENQGYVHGFDEGSAAGLTFNHLVTGGGDFGGTITFNGGTDFGNSPATIDILGNANFGPNNIHVVEIGGLEAGKEYDRVVASQAVELNGTLRAVTLDLQNDYAFELLDRFEIMRFASVTGEFSSLEGTEIGRGMRFEAVQEDNYLELVVVPASWQNYDNRYDVDDDDQVVPLDILLLVTELNYVGARVLPPISIKGEMPPDYWDVSGDGLLTPLDILVLVTYMNDQLKMTGEGELTSFTSPVTATGSSSIPLDWTNDDVNDREAGSPIPWTVTVDSDYGGTPTAALPGQFTSSTFEPLLPARTWTHHAAAVDTLFTDPYTVRVPIIDRSALTASSVDRVIDDLATDIWDDLLLEDLAMASNAGRQEVGLR